MEETVKTLSELPFWGLEVQSLHWFRYCKLGICEGGRYCLYNVGEWGV